MLDVIPNLLCTAESLFFHKGPSYSLLLIYLACAAIEIGYICVKQSMGRSSVLLKALPTLRFSAVGDRPSPLQLLQAWAGDKALGVPAPTLQGDAHYPVVAYCLLSN